MFSRILIIALLAAFAPLGAHAQSIPTTEDSIIGPETGLPIPRFISIRSDEARMRSQPSTDHSILYIYLRVGLPMKVLEERGDWRRVEDHEGIIGWMKNTILSNDRTYRVMTAQTTLYARPELDSDIRAQLEEGVIGTLRTCREDGWCRASVENVSGWLRTEDLWGILPGETF